MICIDKLKAVNNKGVVIPKKSKRGLREFDSKPNYLLAL